MYYQSRAYFCTMQERKPTLALELVQALDAEKAKAGNLALV